MTRFLRAIAVAIAIAALVDPAFTMSGRTRARLAVVVQDGPTMALPAADGTTRRAAAERARDRLVRALGSEYDIHAGVTSDAAAAIVIGDRYPETSVVSGFSRTVSTVTVAGDVTPNVRIVRVDAPRDVPAGTAVRLGVDVEGRGVDGQASELVVRIDGLEVARTSHQWKGAREQFHAELDAVPVGEPPFVVRVEAQRLDTERTALDNTVDALVDLRRAPFRVQVYEPRPSWATTFVRRALEADPRFHVAGVTITSRPPGGTKAARRVATITAEPAPLPRASTLDAFDVVIVGGLDRLTAEDARGLDRFMRKRGGAVVLVPDAPLDRGPARGLLDDVALQERLSDRPEPLAVTAPLAPIRASELLIADNTGTPGAARVAVASGAGASPVVFSTPRGAGQLMFSGALDAWRFRADNENAFDRFWQATVAGLASAVTPPIDVSIEPPILTPGEYGEVVVRVRASGSGADTRGSGTAEAVPYGPGAAPHVRSVRASLDGRPIRLWPEAELGVFRGSFIAPVSVGRATMVAYVDGGPTETASRRLIVQTDVRRRLPSHQPPLAMLSASHRGIDARADQVGLVEAFVRTHVTPTAAMVTRHPMRSAWWILPFASCLSGEWWLRRRRGQR